MVEEPLAPGKSLGGFKLEELIHSGGMATLWRVTRDDIPMPVVMKIPRLKMGEEASAVIGFEVEQMILPKLTGKHVPRFIAAGYQANHPFLVMEYIAGGSLEDLLKKGPLEIHEIADTVAKVAKAVHDLHRQHVIHLDLTPDNILFRRSGTAVLVDFGLSVHDQLPDLMAEVYSQPIGTAPYIAPEQVLLVRSDPRSDIFSLGVILYQMTTGKLPFDNPDSNAGLKRRLYLDPDPPRALNRDCPRWLQEIILRCLEVDPNQRFGSAAQLAFALQDPTQIALTERAERAKPGTLKTTLKQCLQYLKKGAPVARSVARQLDAVPIIMVAVDITPGRMEPLANPLRQAAQRVFHSAKGARLTCVNVRKTLRIGIDPSSDEEGRNLFLHHLVELKHWARPLNIPPDQISFHVLEAPDPAVALVDYARTNHVDHIVIGAVRTLSMRGFLTTVTARVVALAACSVTVVRIHEADVSQRSGSPGGDGLPGA